MTDSAAFDLAAACCRPAGAARDAAVRAAAQGVDWSRFARVLSRHRIEGLAQEALRAAEIAVPPGTAAALRRTAADIGVAGLRMAVESVRLQGALDAAGIANLVVKGATLDILAWGRLGLKQSWDIDIVVAESDAAHARQVLDEAGYDLESPGDSRRESFETWVGLAKECVFRHRQSGVVLELHWRLVDAAGLLPGVNARSPAQVVRLSSALSLRTLAGPELFAYLAVHGTSHAWSRLKWLADLGALLARETEAGRVDLYRRARALGAGRCPATALLLCERLLALPLPAELAAEIRADRRARRLAALAMDALGGGGGETEIADRPLFAERILLSHVLFEDGWAFLWAEVSRQGISVDDHMRFRLPRPWALLYVPLRAPLWLWRRVDRLFRRS